MASRRGWFMLCDIKNIYKAIIDLLLHILCVNIIVLKLEVKDFAKIVYSC